VLLAVVGIIGSIWFLQEEKTERQKDIEKRLEEATSELLDMSSDLIENTKEILELRNAFDDEIRQEKEAFQKEIDEKRNI